MASLVKKAKTKTKVFSWDYSLHIITYPKSYAKETPFMDLLLNSHHPYILGSTTVQTPEGPKKAVLVSLLKWHRTCQSGTAVPKPLIVS